MSKEKIIKKVKGLLAIARDEADDQECQSAFLLAQRLMVQHQIDQNDVEGELENIPKEAIVTAYKKLFWWEKALATVVADNFRVKSFIQLRRMSSSDYLKKSRLVFYGLPEDTALATAIYDQASQALVFFWKLYLKKYSVMQHETVNRSDAARLKNAYFQGFISGLSEGYKTQKQQWSTDQFDLSVLTEVPQVVHEAWKDLAQDFGQDHTKWPEIKDEGAFFAGYTRGKEAPNERKRVSYD